MKYLLAVLILTMVVVACDNTPKATDLIAKNDCLTCHKIEEKSIGPAYKDVAKKYAATEENIIMLSEKVIKGGTGVWGEVPMTPHPQLSKTDAEIIVKYILTLNK